MESGYLQNMGRDEINRSLGRARCQVGHPTNYTGLDTVTVATVRYINFLTLQTISLYKKIEVSTCVRHLIITFSYEVRFCFPKKAVPCWVLFLNFWF